MAEEDERPFTAKIRESAPPPSCHLLLSMIDEALQMMKSLSYLSYKTLDELQLSRGSLEQEVFAALDDTRLCSLAYESASGLDIPLKEKELATAAWRACRLFITRKDALKAFFSNKEQAQSLVTFHCVLEQFRSLVVKRLTTTLEEESAIKAYLDNVFRCEERAIKDHTALSQQLKTERELRLKAFEEFKSEEQHLHEEVQTEKNDALANMRQMQIEYDTTEEDESKNFLQKDKKMSEEIAQLKATLDKMQEDNRVVELVTRFKKEQSVEEVAEILEDYKAELAKKQNEIDRLSVQHTEVDGKMEFYEGYYERRALEEKQRQEEADAKALADFTCKRSAKLIQRVWRGFIKKKKAEEAARKKKEAAAKKKKK